MGSYKSGSSDAREMYTSFKRSCLVRGYMYASLKILGMKKLRDPRHWKSRSAGFNEVAFLKCSRYGSFVDVQKQPESFTFQ